MLADVDALINSGSDPLLVLQFHRHFTHSVFFIPVGALVAATILWPFFKTRLQFKQVYLFSLAGYSFSGFIDACTSYGTSLLWPLSDSRIAFNLISIVDPVFTLALIAGVFMSYRNQLIKFAHWSLLFAAIYLLISGVQMYRAKQVVYHIAELRGHHASRILVKPSFANIILWRTLYEYDGQYYVDAVNLFGAATFYSGDTVAAFTADQVAEQYSNSVLLNDIKRFQYFSNNYLAVSEHNPELIIDVRYSMIPNSLEPLWGIVVDKKNPANHVKFEVFRKLDKSKRVQFMNMLLARK